MSDKAVPQGANGHLDKAQVDWLRLMPDGWDGTHPVGATDVLQAIDQLRRDLSGYHGQLIAHNDLQRHCDNQRERIAELEGLYAKAKDENAKLRELVRIAGTYCVNGYCDPGDGCPLLVDGKCQLTDRMRELGVEV